VIPTGRNSTSGPKAGADCSASGSSVVWAWPCVEPRCVGGSARRSRVDGSYSLRKRSRSMTGTPGWLASPS